VAPAAVAAGVFFADQSSLPVARVGAPIHD
jgi:hypothetical protein